MAATSTIHTYLEYKATSGSTYSKLCDIKAYPDLTDPPERVDVTTLSDENRHYVPGVRDLPDYDFTANFDLTDYTTITGLAGTTYDFRLKFGENGEYGKFDFSGTVTATVNGGDVNAAREMTINIYPTTDVTLGT